MLDRLSFLALLAIPTVACTSTSRMSMEASPAFDVKVVERDGSRIVDLKVVQRHALSEVVAAINGRFLDTPERRTVQMLALASDGAVIADERAVATLAWDALPKSGMDRAQVVLQIPQDPRIATVELRLLTEWQ
jgi:hypothetical protein